MANPHRSARLATLLLGIGATAFALLAAEGAIRLLRPYNSPETLARYSMRYVPSVFARYRIAPAGRLVELDGGKAWGTKPEDAPPERAYRINELGFRAPAFEIDKPDGLTRIFVLGGSAAFDLNAVDESAQRGNAWPDLVGRALEADGLGPLEVINAGVPGYATFDSLGRLHAQLWMYEPDVVLVYHAWNDIKYWKKFEIHPQKPLIERVPVFVDDQNPFTSYQGWWDRLLCHSQLYVKLRTRYFKSRVSFDLEGRVGPDTGERADRYGAWGPRQFRLHLELLVDAIRHIGALPVLITQATLAAPDSPPEDRERIAYQWQLLSHEALVAAFGEANEIVRAVGRDKGAAVIDAAARLSGRSEIFADTVHTTPEGSRALAALVARELAPQLR